MHVHVVAHGMRTTVEISDEQRGRLLELAARRGEKGFSKIVQEALDAYLQAAGGLDEPRRLALTLRGSVNDEDAEAMLSAVRELREHWR
jgi:hypothetical protein